MTNKTHICFHSGFEFERNIVFVAPRTSVRFLFFVIMGLSSNCLRLGMLEMQDTVSGKHICYVMTFFRVGITASKMECLSEANLSAG